MANVFDLSTTAKRFRFIAVLEAFTWLGLLIGMAFKYIPEDGNQMGVRVFGAFHGAVFVIYVLIALWTAKQLKWSLLTTFWALFASVPPFGTVVFERWAVRNGKLGELSANSTSVKDNAALV